MQLMPQTASLASPHTSQPVRAPADPSDIAACRAMLHEGSLTFFAASLLLPRAVREPASALYAFCRLADDVVDLGDGQPGAVDGLRLRLMRAYQGQPVPVAADRALASVVAQYDIPIALPMALLEGFEWDAQGRTYETLEELQQYAARVAAAVGAMMALLMGVRTPDGLARACDLGVAMQLSNIARDVGEDARMGRIYLPLQWLREAGIDPDGFLGDPVFSPALASVVQRLLRAADTLYTRVHVGVAQLPAACRPGINAARFLYAEIGHEVERNGCNSVDQRAVVPASRKAWLLTRSLIEVNPSGADVDLPPLDATRYLVEAAASSRPMPAAAPRAPSWWRLKDRAIWLIDFFDRLEQRKQSRRRSAAG
jgi:phytoene synthase